MARARKGASNGRRGRRRFYLAHTDDTRRGRRRRTAHGPQLAHRYIYMHMWL